MFGFADIVGIVVGAVNDDDAAGRAAPPGCRTPGNEVSPSALEDRELEFCGRPLAGADWKLNEGASPPLPCEESEKPCECCCC